jgi:hypothetical protein
MSRKKSQKVARYRLRLVSTELGEAVWSDLAAHEHLTPKDGYVEWRMDNYAEMGNEVFDYLGPKGTLVLGWGEHSDEAAPPDDLWSQVDQIIRDLMGDWEKARFDITYETDESEIQIHFEVLD